MSFIKKLFDCKEEIKGPKIIVMEESAFNLDTSTLDLVNFKIEFRIKYFIESTLDDTVRFCLVSGIPRNVIVKYFANSHSTNVVSRQNIIALEGFIKDEIHMELLKPSSILSREYKYFTLQNVLITSVTVIKT